MKPEIALLLHGDEHNDRGGPYTRINMLKNYLLEKGLNAEIIYELNERNINKFDIIHVFNVWPLKTSFQSILFAKNNGKKVIFSPIFLETKFWPIYDSLIDQIILDTNNTSIIKLFKTLKHYIENNKTLIDRCQGIKNYNETLCKCCNLSDHIIFLSKKEKQIINTIVGHIESYDIVYNAIDANFVQQGGNESFKKKYNLNKYVLSVGRVEHRKNHLLLIQLAKKFNNIKFVIIGKVSNSNYSNALTKNKPNNVLFLDRIENRKILASAYSGASCFFLPSWSEGASLSAIEAGLFGVPLILTTESSEKEYFGSYAEYIKPYDYKDMQRKLKKILEKEETTNEKYERSIYCRKKFNFLEHGDKMLKIYQSLEIGNPIFKSNTIGVTKNFDYIHLNKKSISFIIFRLLIKFRLLKFIPVVIESFMLKKFLKINPCRNG